MGWLWMGKSGVNFPRQKNLTFAEIDKLRRLGDDYVRFMAAGQRIGGAAPSNLLNTATREEIRAGAIENLMVLLKSGLTFPQQIKAMEATTTMLLTMRYFETQPAGGQREIEAEESYNRSMELWDVFQDLITKDDGRRFEVNEEEIREKVVIKLLEKIK